VEQSKTRNEHGSGTQIELGRPTVTNWAWRPSAELRCPHKRRSQLAIPLPSSTQTKY
jgi:hypothetical protein